MGAGTTAPRQNAGCISNILVFFVPDGPRLSGISLSTILVEFHSVRITPFSTRETRDFLVMSNSSAPRNRKLYSPRTWPAWIGFALLRLLVLLPYPWLLRISQVLAYPIKLLAARRRKIAEVNLRTCFPEKGPTEIERLLHRHIASAVMGLFEMTMAWWWPDHRLRPLIRLEGEEHLEAALAKGKGVLLLGSHITSLEMMGRLLDMKIKHPLSGMYRPHENPVIEFFFQRHRQQFFSHLVRRDDMRGFIKELKNNHVVWYAPDQNFRKKGSIIAPFFGVPAPTFPGTPRIVKISGAQVVPIEYRRLPGNEGYLIKLHPAWENFPTDDELADVTRINRLFEQMILHAPEQYFWIHRKFKIRGQEVTDIYRQHGID